MKKRIVKKQHNKQYLIHKSIRGITLMALVITVIVLLILAGTTIYLALGDNGIIRKSKQARGEYEQASKNEQVAINKVGDYITSSDTETYNYQKGVNNPVLKSGMIPIKWNGSNWVVTTIEDEEWFSYDETQKRWANVMLSDGTYKAGQVAKNTVVKENELREYVCMDSKI